jgi:putative NADH-flavin reductase
MRIGIIGASGNIGSRVLAEARGRGHDVVAFTRQGAASRPAQEGVQWRDLDIFDVDGLTRAIQRLDVLVSSYHPGNSAKDAVDAIGQAIADSSAYARAAKGMLKALESRPATRLIVVGGAANLEIAPGKTTDEDEPRLREVLRSVGVPEEYVVAARGHRDALHTLRISNRRWTYATPSAEIRTGERTGRFRIGGDQLLFDASGRSWISYEDFAAAILDEIEWPRHIQRRFTVGY